MPRRLASSALKLGAIVLVVVITALVAELAITLIIGEQPKFPRYVVGAPWGVRMNIPHARYRHKSADMTTHFHINGQGMRADHDVPYAKPRGTLRILSLGDSFTLGYEVDAESTFSSVLERELRARGYRIEVLNAGVSGFGTAEEYVYLVREGLKYHPDAVLVTFWINDLVDNERSRLFAMKDGRLVETASTYVPGGGTADRLNESPILQWLSQYSNAFALVKERLTEVAKHEVVRQDLRSAPAATTTGKWDVMVRAQNELEAALMSKMYEATRARGIPLIVQTIPVEVGAPPQLTDIFPADLFDVHRPGLLFSPTKRVLDPYEGRRLLYWKRSAGHWTPLSHALAGRALAALVDSAGVLPRATAQVAAARPATARGAGR